MNLTELVLIVYGLKKRLTRAGKIKEAFLEEVKFQMGFAE